MDSIFDDLLSKDHKFDPRNLPIALYASASINYFKKSVFDSAILAIADLDLPMSDHDFGYLV